MIEFKDVNNPGTVKQSISQRLKSCRPSGIYLGSFLNKSFKPQIPPLSAYSVSEKQVGVSAYLRAGRVPRKYQLWGKNSPFEPAATFIISRVWGFFYGGF